MTQDESAQRVRGVLAALDAGPPRRRRDFLALTMYCRGCDDIVAEVFNLKPERVLRYRESLPATRRDGFVRLPAPEPEDTGNLIVPALCACAAFELRVSSIYRLLAEGNRRVALDPSN